MVPMAVIRNSSQFGDNPLAHIAGEMEDQVADAI